MKFGILSREGGSPKCGNSLGAYPCLASSLIQLGGNEGPEILRCGDPLLPIRSLRCISWTGPMKGGVCRDIIQSGHLKKKKMRVIGLFQGARDQDVICGSTRAEKREGVKKTWRLASIPLLTPPPSPPPTPLCPDLRGNCQIWTLA